MPRVAFEPLELRLLLATVPIMLGSFDDGDPDQIGDPGVSFKRITYFAARSATGVVAQADAGIELWRTDDTPAGTFRLKDINPGSGSSEPKHFLVVGDTLFFTADDGINGRELWKTDGTAAGTTMVKDINVNGEIVLGTGVSYTEPSNPLSLTNVNGTLFFTAVAGLSGTELWKSDGTAAGTMMVKDINPGNGSSEPLHLTNVGGKLLFSADDGVRGHELWKSDGTTAGTVLVKDINRGPEGSSPGGQDPDGLLDNPTPFAVLNGKLIFWASRSDSTGLWVSDGTTAGTSMIKTDTETGQQMTCTNSLVFFTIKRVNSAETDIEELWKTDGTTAGTAMVRDFGADWGVQHLSNFNGNLLLKTYYLSSGEIAAELWRSNGAPAGTRRIAELLPKTRVADNPESQSLLFAMSVPSVVRADGMYFANGVAPNGILDSKSFRFALWKSDGTTAGTIEVQSALSGLQQVFPLLNRLDRGTRYSDGPLQVAAASFDRSTAFYRFLPPRATPDVNGDGRADVIARDTATGQVLAEIRGREGALKETRVLGMEPLPLALNGSFETSVAGDRKIVTYGVNQSIGAWRVLEGEVQVKGSGYWQHAAGSQSLDLNGSQRGGIYQDVTTTPGATYDLSLRLAGNPEGGPTIKTADIYWGPVGSQTLLRQVTFDTTGRSNTAMGWATVNLPDLKATGSSTRLTIISRTSGEYGPVVDDVQLVAGGAANRVFVAAADVTGDGIADLIWRRPATGVHTVWVMALNGTVVSRNTLSSNANLALVATGDYDADSREDLVWRNTTAGRHTMWSMGKGLSSVKTDLGVGSTSQVVSSDPRFDANDDGKTDLVWRNTATNSTNLWLMNGPRAASVLAIANGTTADAPVGTGDFNGDGFGDVLWRSGSTGKVTQQLMRNGLVVSSAVLGGSLDDTVIWTGDVSGDRRTDIVWNRRSTGMNSTWVMNGGIRQAAWAAIGNATSRFLVRRPGA